MCERCHSGFYKRKRSDHLDVNIGEPKFPPQGEYRDGWLRLGYGVLNLEKMDNSTVTDIVSYISANEGIIRKGADVKSEDLLDLLVEPNTLFKTLSFGEVPVVDLPTMVVEYTVVYPVLAEDDKGDTYSVYKQETLHTELSTILMTESIISHLRNSFDIYQSMALSILRLFSSPDIENISEFRKRVIGMDLHTNFEKTHPSAIELDLMINIHADCLIRLCEKYYEDWLDIRGETNDDFYPWADKIFSRLYKFNMDILKVLLKDVDDMSYVNSIITRMIKHNILFDARESKSRLNMSRIYWDLENEAVGAMFKVMSLVNNEDLQGDIQAKAKRYVEQFINLKTKLGTGLSYEIARDDRGAVVSHVFLMLMTDLYSVTGTRYGDTKEYFYNAWSIFSFKFDKLFSAKRNLKMHIRQLKKAQDFFILREEKLQAGMLDHILESLTQLETDFYERFEFDPYFEVPFREQYGEFLSKIWEIHTSPDNDIESVLSMIQFPLPTLSTEKQNVLLYKWLQLIEAVNNVIKFNYLEEMGGVDMGIFSNVNLGKVISYVHAARNNVIAAKCK